jgi:hypothetical protein
MTSLTDLYQELKGDVVALADPLFEQSQNRLQASDEFLPHAAVLTAEGKVVMLGAMTGTRGGSANAAQVLAMVHSGLRQMSREKVLVAVGVAEQVYVERGEEPVSAIQVLLEHERGLTVAMYLPYWKVEGACAFGEAFVTPAAPALNLWTPVP